MWEVGEGGIPEVFPDGGGLCTFSGMFLPHSRPGHPHGDVFPLDPSECQRAVWTEGMWASKPQPQGPSFGLCSSLPG